MAFPTIEELRLQCRIDHDDEDNILNIYLKAAIKRTENYLKRSLIVQEHEDNNDQWLVISDDIKAALIFVVGYWYDCRDLSKIPTGFYELIKPYRVITI